MKNFLYNCPGVSADQMIKKISIHIGEMYASKGVVVIHTLLGSCVSVCLFDSVAKIGGINHILLPGKADIKHFDDAARYGINAMELLINKVIKLGARRNRLTAKVFGGAHVIMNIKEDNSPGYKNAEFTLEFLKIEKIPVVSRDIGGYNARRIYFHTYSGDVFLKRIPSFHFSKLAAEEKKYQKRVKEEAKRKGQVTLFK